MPLMAEQSDAHHVWAVVARSRPNPRATAPRGRGFPPGARGFFWCRRLDPALFTPRLSVGTVPAFYSVHEAKKPAANRVYHNNDACHSGGCIPGRERMSGTGEYRLCEDCERLNREHK